MDHTSPRWHLLWNNSNNVAFRVNSCQCKKRLVPVWRPHDRNHIQLKVWYVTFCGKKKASWINTIQYMLCSGPTLWNDSRRKPDVGLDQNTLSLFCIKLSSALFNLHQNTVWWVLELPDLSGWAVNRHSSSSCWAEQLCKVCLQRGVLLKHACYYQW